MIIVSSTKVASEFKLLNSYTNDLTKMRLVIINNIRFSREI